MQSTVQTAWTAEQLLAINTVGKSLLVSAAAGSGKTSVLAERCVQLLCDGEAGCEVGNLLVVTFTDAAALEMKSRIARSLSQKHASSPGELTARHLAMLDRASIGTLHGFCFRLLRQHFQLLGLDPTFRIIDADEAMLQKLDTARELFANRYDDAEADDFRRMVDCYGEGNDEWLVRQVIKAYDTLCSVVDPIGWLKSAGSRIDEAIDLPLRQSELGKAYLETIGGELESVLNESEASAKALKSTGRFESYVNHLRVLHGILKQWLGVLQSEGLDALSSRLASEALPAIPRTSGEIEGKDAAKKLVDSIRIEMTKGSLAKCLRFTEQEWKQGLAQTRPHVDVLLALIADFATAYDNAKNELNVLDFSDLERLTLRALKVDGSNPSQPTVLARSFHQQFKHVLVDEYQDINQVQDEILSLVSRECMGGRGGLAANLFCVGDVKQSIYRFRLAEAQQFLDRRTAYSRSGGHGRVIDLQANFRSRAPLLEAINGVFERLMTREAADLDYDSTQKLSPGKAFAVIENGFTGAPIELHLVPKDGVDSESEGPELDRSEREAVLVGKRILELVSSQKQIVAGGNKGEGHRRIRFSDIVILLRSLRFKADQFAATLRNMGVPVHTESATGYFEATEVNDILSLLHVLDNQSQDIPLAAVLRSPLSGLDEVEDHLARISIAYSGDAFHVAVQKYAQLQNDWLAGFLRDFQKKLETWRQEIRRRPVAEVLWKIYDQTGYLAYVAGLVNGEQRQANLIELHDRAAQFATFQRQGLGRFLQFLEKLKNESDLGQASIASEADDVVRIMSIHRSKGQEFPVVVLPDLGKAINLQDTQGSILLDRQAGLGMQVVDDELRVRYPSLASTVVQNRLRQQTMAEELRVLYVAMTRAKEHLILVGTCAGKKQADIFAQWSSHEGAFPAPTVLGAGCTLDWLLLAAAVLPEKIQVQVHDAEEIAEWSIDPKEESERTPAQIAVAAGRPLEPPPVRGEEAEQLIAELNLSYPHGEVADLAAAVSVTSLVKSAGTVGGASSGSIDRLLPLPAFRVGDLPVSAADRGTATHVLLEHFDFERPGEIEQQIGHLVTTKRLTQQMSVEVDRRAIEWFLSSEVGQLIRRAKGLGRELPVYFANVTDATDPMDQQMVRGRIDLLVPTEKGWMIVDYKTDNVNGEMLEQRTALYAQQLNRYREAIARITGAGEIESAIVFLTAREIRRV